jgi:WD40 repeat protein
MSFNTAVSPHLDRLAVQLGNGRVKVWDIGRRPRLATSVLPQSNVLDLCFSPDGRLLATQDEQGEVAIFDTRKPVALGRVLAAPNANRLSFSPDGRLLSAGSDSRVVIWSTATGGSLVVSRDAHSAASSLVHGRGGSGDRRRSLSGRRCRPAAPVRAESGEPELLGLGR